MSYHGTTGYSANNNRQRRRPVAPPSTPSGGDTSSAYSELPEAKRSGVSENLYTGGGEFLTPDGNPYVGPYHIHPTKGAMVGAKHVDAPHAILTPVESVAEEKTTATQLQTVVPDLSLTDRDFSLNVRAEEIVSPFGQNTVSIDICNLIYPDFGESVTSGLIGTLRLGVKDLAEKLEVGPTELYDVKNFSEVRVEEDFGSDQFKPCTLDVDNDGYVTQSDIERIYDFSTQIPIKFDIDGDGVVTEEDFLLAKEYIGTICVETPLDPTVEDELVKNGCFFRITPKSYTPDTAYFVSSNWDQGVSNSDGQDIYTAEGYMFPLRNLAFDFHPVLKELGEDFYEETRANFRGRSLDSYNENSGFLMLNTTDVLGSDYDPVALETTNFPQSSLYFHLGGSDINQDMLKRRYFDAFQCFPLGGGNPGAPPTSPPAFQSHCGPTTQEPGKMGVSTSMTLEFFFKPLQATLPGNQTVLYTVPLHGTGTYPIYLRENANDGIFYFTWRTPKEDYPKPGYRGAPDQEDINGVSYQEYLDSDFTIPFDAVSAIPNSNAYTMQHSLYITDDQTAQGGSLIEYDSWNYLAITFNGQTMSAHVNGISISKSIGDKRFDGHFHDRVDPYPNDSGDRILMTAIRTGGMCMRYPYSNNNSFILPPSGGVSSCELHSVSVYNRILSFLELRQNRLALEALNLE